MELFRMSVQWWLKVWETQSHYNESLFRSLFSVLPKQQSQQAMAWVMSIHEAERAVREGLKMWIR